MVVLEIVHHVGGAEERVAQDDPEAGGGAGHRVTERVEGALWSTVGKFLLLAVYVDQLGERHVDLWPARTSELVDETSIGVGVAAGHRERLDLPTGLHRTKAFDELLDNVGRQRLRGCPGVQPGWLGEVVSRELPRARFVRDGDRCKCHLQRRIKSAVHGLDGQAHEFSCVFGGVDATEEHRARIVVDVIQVQTVCNSVDIAAEDHSFDNGRGLVGLNLGGVCDFAARYIRVDLGFAKSIADSHDPLFCAIDLLGRSHCEVGEGSISKLDGLGDVLTGNIERAVGSGELFLEGHVGRGFRSIIATEGASGRLVAEVRSRRWNPQVTAARVQGDFEALRWSANGDVGVVCLIQRSETAWIYFNNGYTHEFANILSQGIVQKLSLSQTSNIWRSLHKVELQILGS